MSERMSPVPAPPGAVPPADEARTLDVIGVLVQVVEVLDVGGDADDVRELLNTYRHRRHPEGVSVLQIARVWADRPWRRI